MITKKKAKGFALLESVISAVVISGYVASIHTAEADKQQVVDALNMSKASQVAVSEYYKKNGTLPTNTADIKLDSKSINQKVANISLSEFGEIVITLENSQAIANKTIVLEPNITAGNIDWSCANGSLDNSYRPKNCYKDSRATIEGSDKLDADNDNNYI